MALLGTTILCLTTGENCDVEKRPVSRGPFPEEIPSWDQKPPSLHAHHRTQPLSHPKRLNHEDGGNMLLRSVGIHPLCYNAEDHSSPITLCKSHNL
jgi:hypothetical protein